MAKIFMTYWSGTGNTEKMAELIEKGAAGVGAEVLRKTVDGVSPGDVAGYDVVVLGSPSMGAEVIEEAEMEPFVEAVTPSLKGVKVALFGSYGWGDGEWMRTWSAKMKDAGCVLLDDGLIVNETPDGESASLCEEYGKKLAEFAGK